MAVNITQKDNTLNTIITWAKQHKREASIVGSDYAYTTGRNDVLDELIRYCTNNLGYSNPDMPLEVPNQSETSENLASAALKAARRATL